MAGSKYCFCRNCKHAIREGYQWYCPIYKAYYKDNDGGSCNYFEQR